MNCCSFEKGVKTEFLKSGNFYNFWLWLHSLLSLFQRGNDSENLPFIHQGNRVLLLLWSCSLFRCKLSQLPGMNQEFILAALPRECCSSLQFSFCINKLGLHREVIS